MIWGEATGSGICRGLSVIFRLARASGIFLLFEFALSSRVPIFFSLNSVLIFSSEFPSVFLYKFSKEVILFSTKKKRNRSRILKVSRSWSKSSCCNYWSVRPCYFSFQSNSRNFIVLGDEKSLCLLPLLHPCDSLSRYYVVQRIAIRNYRPWNSDMHILMHYALISFLCSDQAIFFFQFWLFFFTENIWLVLKMLFFHLRTTRSVGIYEELEFRMNVCWNPSTHIFSLVQFFQRKV